MPIGNVLVGVAVADIDAARAWYECLLCRPADSLPMPSVAEWNLVGGGWIQLSLDAERAGSSPVNLGVDDVDAHVAGLAKRGLALEAADTASGMFRIATATDPDGNTITLAQDLRGSDPLSSRPDRQPSAVRSTVSTTSRSSSARGRTISSSLSQ